MIKRIYIDLDGLIANFSLAACNSCNIPYPLNTEFGDTWLDEKCGKDIWNHCAGQEFWSNLSPFPWAQTLVHLVDSYAPKNWVFLTKSSFDAGCYSGKFLWIKQHFPNHTDKLWIVNGNKNMACGSAQDLLIDDKIKNIEQWKDAGGSTYHWTEVTPDWPADQIAKRLSDIELLLKS